MNQQLKEDEQLNLFSFLKKLSVDAERTFSDLKKIRIQDPLQFRENAGLSSLTSRDHFNNGNRSFW